MRRRRHGGVRAARGGLPLLIMAAAADASVLFAGNARVDTSTVAGVAPGANVRFEALLDPTDLETPPDLTFAEYGVESFTATIGSMHVTCDAASTIFFVGDNEKDLDDFVALEAQGWPTPPCSVDSIPIGRMQLELLDRDRDALTSNAIPPNSSLGEFDDTRSFDFWSFSIGDMRSTVTSLPEPRLAPLAMLVVLGFLRRWSQAAFNVERTLDPGRMSRLSHNGSRRPSKYGPRRPYFCCARSDQRLRRGSQASSTAMATSEDSNAPGSGEK